MINGLIVYLFYDSELSVYSPELISVIAFLVPLVLFVVIVFLVNLIRRF